MADARRFGASPEEIAGLLQHLGATPAGTTLVWKQNRPIVEAFLVGASQWRTSLRHTDRGVQTYWIGLDYTGLRASIDASNIEVSPALWSGVQVIEFAARDALNGETVH